MKFFGEESLFSNLNTAQGAGTAAIVMLVILCVVLLMRFTNLNIIQLFKKFINFLLKVVGKLINKQEKAYHRDIEIGKINEKRLKSKLYRFLSDLIIDLRYSESGITPYELLFIVSFLTTAGVLIICRILFGNILIGIVLVPIGIVGVLCTMYTRANVAHDRRIEAVLEAENIICNNIKSGVIVAVRDSLNTLPIEVRQEFKVFLDNVEQQNYHIKTALMDLNQRLGGIADDFIRKCIVYELEEQHGIAGMFNDIVEMNNIKMESRTEMKRRFEEVKHQFIIGAGMIYVFLAAVLVIYKDVRTFYLTTGIGQTIIAIDILIVIAEFVYITYLRAKEL